MKPLAEVPVKTEGTYYGPFGVSWGKLYTHRPGVFSWQNHTAVQEKERTPQDPTDVILLEDGQRFVYSSETGMWHKDNDPLEDVLL